MCNKKHTSLLPVRVISVISKYDNHQYSCFIHTICYNNENESMNGNQQGVTPSELMSLWFFAKDVINRIQQGTAINFEEHVQHLLSLSSILLLKPARTHIDLHKHIDLSTCDALFHGIIGTHKMTNQMLPTEVKLQLEEIIIQLDVDGDQGNACTRLAVSQRISALIQDGDVLNPINRILLSIRNMVEKLPRRIIENGPKETELITRHLEAILSPLFEDLDNNIAFRWTSVSDDEKQANIRPDASINIIHVALLSDRIDCGEVKAQYQALNHRLTSIDLLRVATLAKDASDKHKLKSILAFLIAGKNSTGDALTENTMR